MTETRALSRSGLDPDTAARFTHSAVTHQDLSGFREWWAERLATDHFAVDRIPFAELDKWHFDATTGNLEHETGKFFTVEGLRVSADGESSWTQPILHQPEIAILGLLAKEFDGVLHFLMQAKMEPGNCNIRQLSPTVQATPSNYNRVHNGGATRYLEYFKGADRGQVLVDVLQSEQGVWFLAKRNRNMVVRVTGDVPEHPDFRWVSLNQVRQLFREDNMVNMDARTVVSCMPLAAPRSDRPWSPFLDALLKSYEDDLALHSQDEVNSWFTESKAECEWFRRTIPLAEVSGWTRAADEIVDDLHEEFRIVGVNVEAGNREIAKWKQPLLMPCRERTAIMLVRPIAGVLHMLVQATPQAGLRDLVEVGPTVQLPESEHTEKRFADIAMTTDGSKVHFDTVLSEEGGRFYRAQTRYRVVEVGEEFPVEVPENYCWVTVRQLTDLVRHEHYVNIEARTLLGCVHSLW